MKANRTNHRPGDSTYQRLAIDHVNRLVAGDLTTDDLELLGVARFAEAVDAEMDSRGLR
jgi:hypothetical protein